MQVFAAGTVAGLLQHRGVTRLLLSVILIRVDSVGIVRTGSAWMVVVVVVVVVVMVLVVEGFAEEMMVVVQRGVVGIADTAAAVDRPIAGGADVHRFLRGVRVG